MRNPRNELLVEIGLVLVVALLIGREGYQFFVAPRLEEVTALESELADLRDNKAWGRSLRSRLSASEAALPRRLEALREIEGHFLHDENDRLRILDVWDRVSKQLPDLRVQSDPGMGHTQSYDFRCTEPLAEEATELRRKFGKLYPHDELPPWKPPPDTIPVVQMEERLRLSGPFQAVFSFMQKVQSDPLTFEVTHFSARQEGASPDDPVQATVAISAAMFPRDTKPR